MWYECAAELLVDAMKIKGGKGQARTSPVHRLERHGRVRLLRVGRFPEAVFWKKVKGLVESDNFRHLVPELDW